MWTMGNNRPVHETLITGRLALLMLFHFGADGARPRQQRMESDFRLRGFNQLAQAGNGSGEDFVSPRMSRRRYDPFRLRCCFMTVRAATSLARFP